jgi:hypothetical protein
VIAPTSSAEFVAAMEDVLEVYARPPDPDRPLVCMDECTKQLTREVRTPWPSSPGQPAREDYEYERNGVAAIFCAVAPHLGWRQIEERERKTRCDYAVRISLYPKAWELDEHRRNRIERPGPRMPCPSYPGSRHTRRRVARLAM